MVAFLAAMAAAAVMAQAEPEPAPAADAAPAAPAAATAKSEAKPKSEKVCVVEAQMGSHFRRKVCATREEWARRQRRDQEMITGDAPRAGK